VTTRDYIAAILLALALQSVVAAAATPERARPANEARVVIEPTTHTVLVRSTTETLADVRAKIADRIARIDTVRCEIEMSKKRDKKITRKVYTGPLTIARGRGGRVVLERKGEIEEYIANARELWSWDHKKKQAYVLPVNSPIIGFFVAEALKFNAFLAMDEDTIEFLGYQATDGEWCWVFEGKSPSRLRFVGVPVRKMRVWVSPADGLPREIRIPQEKDLTIVLHHIVINAPVSDDEFKGPSSDGVKVKRVLGL